MITKDNLKECFEHLTETQISQLSKGDGDMVSFTVNGYGWVSVERGDFNESEEEEANANGGVYCDMDDFLMLHEEVGAPNKFINEQFK